MWESENQDESPLMTTDNFHGIDGLEYIIRGLFSIAPVAIEAETYPLGLGRLAELSGM
jgi:hypothetical protein